MKRSTIHVIPNAHLDPVWLWDAREGLNEGVATCRAMLDLLDRNPGLVFVRGEAAIYEHVRRTDPPTFARILKAIHAGRWDAVGGTWIQPDTNLLAGETLCRHYDLGLRYFREVLGVRVTTAWQADSFGHTSGLPEVLAAGGIENFAFSRPPQESFPLRLPAFWWRGPSGVRVLAYRMPLGWYGTERDEVARRFAQLPALAAESPLRNIGVFVGLGNHGGGPSQRQIDDVRVWAAAHPEFEVRFSGLHAFFAALRRELLARGAPRIDEIRGELNFCMRGCYASVARFKHAYRRAEDELLRAERTTALLQGAGVAPAADLDGAWRSMLFNSFHDILPGSSIERAFDEQIDEVGGIRHAARQAAFAAANQLARNVRISLPAVPPDHPGAVPFLIWNPHLQPLQTFVGIEAGIDHRPVWSYRGRPRELPLEVRVAGRRAAFQEIATENDCGFGDAPWRKRVLVPVRLPAAGWTVATVGWVEGTEPPVWPHRASAQGTSIRNDFYRVAAVSGQGGIQVWHRGRRLFGRRGIQLTTVRDDWGSWGGMAEEPASIRLRQELSRGKVTRVAVTEAGPLRVALVARVALRDAEVDLTFRLTAGIDALAVEARIFTNLAAARLKLSLPGVTAVECETPAGTVWRRRNGEMPLLRWMRADGPGGGFTLASDVFSACDLESGNLRVTLARATRYSREAPFADGSDWWPPAVDRGELRGRLLLLPRQAPLAAVDAFLQPPLVTMAWNNPGGALPGSLSLAALRPAAVRVLAVRPLSPGGAIELRVQNSGGRSCRPVVRWRGSRRRLGTLRPGEIATFRIPSRSGSPQHIPLGAR